MPRPKVRFDLQPQALRPVASPVDTFYQPQPPIPVEAVDNEWAQLAKAMETLSPSIQRYLKMQEEGAQEKGLEEAKEFRRRWYNPTEKQVKAAFKESVAENKKRDDETEAALAREGVEFERYDPVFDLKAEREKLVTHRVSQAKLFRNMGREEAAEWLKEAQAAVGGGVVLNYAARPDFQLNLQKLMGGGFAKRAKIFTNRAGDLDTYANAISSRVSELAAADDPDAWLREFEAPLQEGIDPAKGQGFLLGAVEGLAAIRQRFKAVAQQERLTNDAAMAIDELVSAGVDIGQHLTLSHSVTDDPIPPGSTPAETLVIQERNKERRSSAQASQSEFVEWFWSVSLDASQPSKKRLSIQSKTFLQIAKGFDEDDPDGDKAEAFLDFVRSIPLVEGAKNTLGETPYWRYALLEISESLERSRRGKRESTRQASDTDAMGNVVNNVWGLIAADDKSGDELKRKHFDTLTEQQWLEELAKPEFQKVIWAALVTEGGEDYADSRIFKITRDAAKHFAMYRTRRAGQTTSAQDELHGKLADRIAIEGGTADVLSAISSADLTHNQKKELRGLWNSKEARSRAQLDYRGVEAAVRKAMQAGMGPDKLPNKVYQRLDALVEKNIHTGFREKWRSSTDDERAQLRATLPLKLAEDLHKSKEWKDLMESSITSKPEVLYEVYGKSIAKEVEQEVIEAFPEQDFARDPKTGELIKDDTGNPFLVQNKNVARNRRVARKRAYQGVLAWVAEQKPQDNDPSDIQVWGPNLFRKLGGEALNKIIDNAIAPPVQVDTQPAPAVTPQQKAVLESDEAARKQAKFNAGMKWAPVRYSIRYGIRTAVPLPFTVPWLEKNILYGPYKIVLSSLDASLDQAMKEQTIEVKSDEVTGNIWTARDQTYKRRNIAILRGGRRSGYSMHTITDNPNYPSDNEARIFWLTSRASDIGKQEDGGFWTFEGDWFMEMGVDYAKFTPSQARQELMGHIMARGLWPAEIIAGKTREGIPFADLGWKDASDIPWKGVLIGRRDSAVHQKDMDAFRDSGTGQIREGWEKTLVGQVLVKMSIDPTAEIPGTTKSNNRPVTMWDMYLARQRDLRKFMVGVRGQDNLARSDRWSHDIPRLDSNAPHGHRFIGKYDGTDRLEKGKGSTDRRIYNHIYRAMNERTRAVLAEFGDIRNKAGGK